MAKEEGEDVLPDKAAAKEFYAKYEPKEVLGRGVSSVVRRCVEKTTGREYAVKIIDLNNDPDDPDGNAIRDATLREVAVLRLVAGHPYIIELHDVFESSTFIFLVFELCRNGELFDYLTNVVTLSEKKTRYFMLQICEALQHVHSKDVVHRDVKPENILLDDDFNIKLTDFGFARVLQPGEKLSETCGTPGYLAPELLRSAMFEDVEGYGREVDVWACGVIMYTLLVGCPPFWHRKQMVMIRNIMEGNFSFSSAEWADITDSPKDLIRKILVVDPKLRLTIDDALQHEFLHGVLKGRRQHSKNLRKSSKSEPSVKPFNARRTFRSAIICVRALVRARKFRFVPAPIELRTAQLDPYRNRQLRKIIDGCAFRVYGHWVKKESGQNRAALFENAPKVEAKQRITEQPVVT